MSPEEKGVIKEAVETLVARVKGMSQQELVQYYREMAQGKTETTIFNAWVAGLELDRRVDLKEKGQRA